MAIGASITMNLRTDAAQIELAEIILQATRDTFELDIVPTAKELSPVTQEGYARNLALKAEGTLSRPAMGTGHNRRSIDSEVNQTPEGPEA